MKWKRTAMSLALAGCMMATTVPVTAFAANTMAVEQQADANDDLASLIVDQTSLTLTTDATKGKVSDTVTISTGDSKLTAGTVTAVSGDEDIVRVSPASQDMTGSNPIQFTIEATAANSTPSIAETGKKGTTTVTFTAKKADGSEVKTTCTVTVGDPIYISGVSIADVTLEKSKQYNAAAKAKVTPANATETLNITNWVSSDPSVAAVNSSTGIVEAKTRGTATITGYYNYGENNVSTNVKFKVTVTDATATLDVTEENSKPSGSDWKINDTLKLTAKQTGTDNAETVTWTSSDNSVATVATDGTVKVIGAGSTVITATAADGIKGYYTIVVPTAGVKATDIAFDKTAVTLMQGATDDTLLTVVTTPKDAELVTGSLDVGLATATVNGVTMDTTSPVQLVPIFGLNDKVYKVTVSSTASTGTYEVKVPVKYKNAAEPNKEIIDTLECVVTVTAADASKAESITLSSANVTMAANTTKDIVNNTASTKPSDALVVTVTPETKEMYDLVSYSIDDTSIAKVVGNAKDGYKVVALKQGSCYLTAKVGKYTAKTQITVTEDKATALSAIKLNKTAAAMLVKDTVDLTVFAQVGDSTAWGPLAFTYTALWSSSNENVATVDQNGHVVAKGVGSATITASVGGKTATCTVNVYDDDATVGFVDVPANAWYANAVNTAAAKGLMNGTGNNKFEPLKTVQRSQVAAIVWNIEGAPAVTGTTPFTDVAADAWYAQAVTWAYQNKVVSGTSATTFAPNQNITRQDFAVVLYNKAGKPAASADLSKFVDASKINSWAQDAVKWAVSKGIINGNDKNELNPTGTLTRAEAASIIVKYVG